MRELELTKKINQFGRGTIIQFFSVLISSSYFLISLFAIIDIFILLHNWEKGLIITLELIAAFSVHFFINEIILKMALKKWINRPRPFVVDSSIKVLGSKIENPSFPSGHVSSITGLATVLFLNFPLIWPLGIIFLILIGFSRIYNGHHYISDVIGGLVIGIGYGLIGLFLANRLIALIE